MNGINIWKFVIAIIWDILDLTIFRIPGIGTLTDIVAVPLGMWLWGPLGIVGLWEVFDFTDNFDAQIPTMTLIGLVTLYGRK